MNRRRQTSTMGLLFVISVWTPTAGGADPQGILIEAEDPDQRVSTSKTFASSTREPAASGRRVVARFFESGHVVYRFEVSSTGVYAAWLPSVVVMTMIAILCKGRL